MWNMKTLALIVQKLFIGKVNDFRHLVKLQGQGHSKIKGLVNRNTHVKYQSFKIAVMVEKILARLKI